MRRVFPGTIGANFSAKAADDQRLGPVGDSRTQILEIEEEASGWQGLLGDSAALALLRLTLKTRAR